MIRSKPATDKSRAGWEQTFRTAKQRYDAKRRGDPVRKCRERARNRMRSVPKSGACEDCGCAAKTVWHHEDYNDQGRNCIELCYTCHRARHPRPMPPAHPTAGQ